MDKEMDIERCYIHVKQDCLVCPTTDQVPPCVEQRKTKENAMFEDTDMMEATQREHLLRRLERVMDQVGEKAERFYGIKDDEYPYKSGDLIRRIKDGLYVYNEQYDQIQWRDPAKKADRPGYDKFWEK